MAQPIRLVGKAYTDPYVTVEDVDFSFEDRWRIAHREALNRLVAEIAPDNKYEVLYRRTGIDRHVKGWTPSVLDGHVVVQVRRHARGREGLTLLRLTCHRAAGLSVPPDHIECVLYEPDHTDAVSQMLARLAWELNFQGDLRVIRLERTPCEGWKPVKKFFS